VNSVHALKILSHTFVNFLHGIANYFTSPGWWVESLRRFIEILEVAKELLLSILGNCRTHLLSGSPNSFGSTSWLAFSCDLCSNLVTRKLV